MSKLNKQSVLALLMTGITPTPIHINEVGEFYIKKLSVGEQTELSELKDKTSAVELSLHLVACSLCDEKGNRIFENNDVETLKQTDSEVLAKLIEHINKINGFDKTADDIKKN